MQLIKILFVFLAVSARTCSGRIVVQTSRAAEERVFNEATENILTSCYENGGRAVVFAGATSETLIRTVSKRKIPVSLIDESYKPRWRHAIQAPRSRYGLHTFVITVSTHTNLMNTFDALKRSQWWNHQAYFLILYSPLVPDKECFFVPTLLHVCYVRSVINAKIMCIYDDDTQLVINYNPFTHHAPRNWPLARRHRGVRGIFFSFWRRYKHEDICDGLDWDKTRDVGGFEIPIMKIRTRDIVTDRMVNTERFRRKLLNILENTMRVLNASARYWEGGQTPGPDNSVVKGMTLNPFNLQSAVTRRTTYPYDVGGAAIMTQFRGHLTQIGKITTVIDRDSRWGVLVVVLITLMFFKFFMRQSIVTAALNVFRIACGTSLTRIPDRISTRLYLGCAFFFYVTVQSFYTGQLASMLTNEVPLRNVDTMKDLMDLGHKIYAHAAYGNSQLAIDEEFKTRFVGLNTTDCSKYVVQDPMAACLNNAEQLLDQAAELKMHLTMDFVISHYDVKLIQLDWILEEKVNRIFLWQIEADIARPLDLRREGQTLRDFQYDEKVKSNKGIKVMTLDELAFAFVFLGIGLTCASLCFICELAIKRIRSRTTTVKIQRLN